MAHYSTKRDRRSTHQQIVRIIRELNQSPILDVGAAQGILGESLVGSDLAIDAVEPDRSRAEAARRSSRTVYNSTVESADLPRACYKVVVCGDVLEHLENPVFALRRCRAAAAEAATFIISVPNIAHVSVRLMLLAGFFPQMERGILDRTHFHCFTCRTAVAMIADAGLRVHDVIAVPVPFELITSSRFINAAAGLVQRPLIFLLPKMFAYQWIFVAREK